MPEAGQVEPAAIVEVELLVLVEERLRVDRRAEVQPALRHAADHAGLGGQRQVVEHPLLGGDRGHAPPGMPMPRLTTPPSGSSKAQRRAMSLRSSSGSRRDPVDRHADLGRERGVVGGAVGLPCVVRLRPARRSRPARREPRTLRAGRAMPCAAMRSTCAMTRPLALRAAIAAASASSISASRSIVMLPVGVGGGAADQRDVDREAPCRTATPRRRSP